MNRHLPLAHARRWAIRRTFLLMQGLQRREKANTQPSGDANSDGPSNEGGWAPGRENATVPNCASWNGLPWELKLDILRRVPAWMNPICRHLVCREWRDLLSRAPDEGASGGGGPETIDATPAMKVRKLRPGQMRHKDVRDALVAEAPLGMIRWTTETMRMYRLCPRRGCEVAAFWGGPTCSSGSIRSRRAGSIGEVRGASASTYAARPSEEETTRSSCGRRSATDAGRQPWR